MLLVLSVGLFTMSCVDSSSADNANYEINSPVDDDNWDYEDDNGKTYDSPTDGRS